MKHLNKNYKRKNKNMSRFFYFYYLAAIFFLSLPIVILGKANDKTGKISATNKTAKKTESVSQKEIKKESLETKASKQNEKKSSGQHLGNLHTNGSLLAL